MKRAAVEALEKVTGQLEGVHREISTLVKKSTTDAVNTFKIGAINRLLASANALLGTAYEPLEGFVQFDKDDVPTNSDVAMVLALYLEELERLRADNIAHEFGTHWRYIVDDGGEEIRAAPPRKVRKN